MFRTRTGLTAAALLVLALSAPAPAVTAARQEIQKPKDQWQKPGEIQKPRDTWQTPGEIQVPKGIQAIRAEETKCTKRFSVGADALFEFDKATLTPDAEETLNALLPLLAKAGKHPASLEGHTDAKGSDAYNQDPEREAGADRQGLARGQGRAARHDAHPGLGQAASHRTQRQTRRLRRSGGAPEEPARGGGARPVQGRGIGSAP